jgi:hypothetical protein
MSKNPEHDKLWPPTYTSAWRADRDTACRGLTRPREWATLISRLIRRSGAGEI